MPAFQIEFKTRKKPFSRGWTIHSDKTWLCSEGKYLYNIKNNSLI